MRLSKVIIKKRTGSIQLNRLVIDNLFWMIIIGYIIDLFLFRIYLSGVVGMLILATFICSDKKRMLVPKTSVFLLLWMLISGIWEYIYGYPMMLYFKGIFYITIPVLMFYTQIDDFNYQYKKYIEAIFFSIIIGILMYVWAPDFYGQYLYAHGNISNPGKGWIRASFNGLYGVTTLSGFSAICGIYYFEKWLYESKRKYLIFFLVSVAALFVTGRRAAIAAWLVIFLFQIVKFFTINKRVLKSQIALLSAGFFLIGVGIVLKWSKFIAWIRRITGFTIAISERKSNWVEVLHMINNKMIIGMGIGTAGHNAGTIGYLGVYDSAYILILAELGIIGIALFIAVIIRSFISFYKIQPQNRNWIPFYVAVLFLIQAIGSNVIEFPIYSAFFWFSLKGMQLKIEEDPHN